MKSAYLKLIKSPNVIIGLLTAVIFQVLFSVIWLTGYDHITDRTDRFHIAIVNEDQEAEQIAAAFQQNLPFQLEQTDDLAAAMKGLEERKVQMVVHIPPHFMESLQNQSHPAAIKYSINESNASMVKTVMDNVAKAMTSSLNTQSVHMGAAAVLKEMQMPAGQADGTAAALSERIVSEFENIHPLSNFSYIMVPMMLVMASFTGAMLLVMEVHKTAKSLNGQYSRWILLGARCMLNLTAALIISGAGSIMVYAMGVHPAGGFVSMWLFQLVYVCTFLFFAQLPFFLIGDAGGWLNIAMLSIQLLSSGATIPREVMSGFYLAVSEYLPATYAVDGIMNIVTGGPGTRGEISQLLILLVLAGGAAALLAGFRKAKRMEPGRPHLLPADQSIALPE